MRKTKEHNSQGDGNLVLEKTERWTKKKPSREGKRWKKEGDRKDRIMGLIGLFFFR